ncbi:MAG: 4'-phosphopantetheinyl transferase superfamily protein [Gammaproteobacteria bacterium]|nr:4'-phosphopantetheinyl transferase superfamily protein [Gammaproteobacteria bacterium]
MPSAYDDPALLQARSHGALRWAWCPHRRGAAAEPRVRAWLAAELRDAPDTLPLRRDRFGRPRLGTPYTRHDVSWSHSGDGLLLARGKDVALGIDLEQFKPRPRALDLARRHFAASEAAWLATLPGQARDAAFVRLWCAKEAVLKAHGRGLAFGLDKLVFGERDGALTLLACDPALGVAADWHLHEFVPSPGYQAVLAWRMGTD